MGIPAIFSWSGGKDSSYALHKLMQEGIFDVRYLLATINGQTRRLSMHGVREELIELQSESIGIPLKKVYVYETDNAYYEKQMGALLEEVRRERIYHVIFGDIFLEDLRKYREEKMTVVGMHCVFPLWNMDTNELLNSFIKEGFKTITCCINDECLDESWCGRLIDKEFLEQLPPGVDPCGENGEYHSFCFDGPIFSKPIKVTAGEKVYRALELKIAEQTPEVQTPEVQTPEVQTPEVQTPEVHTPEVHTPEVQTEPGTKGPARTEMDSDEQISNQSSNHPFPIKKSATQGFWFCELHLLP